VSSKSYFLKKYEFDERDEIIHDKDKEIKKLNEENEVNKSALSRIQEKSYLDINTTKVNVNNKLN